MEGQGVRGTKGQLTCLIHKRVGLGQAHLVAQVHCWAPLPQKWQETSRYTANKGFCGPLSPPAPSGLLSLEFPLIPVPQGQSHTPGPTPALSGLGPRVRTLCAQCPHPHAGVAQVPALGPSSTHHARVEVAGQSAVSVRSALTLARQYQAEVSDAQGM